jgi:hypothetical protein
MKMAGMEATLAVLILACAGEDRAAASEGQAGKQRTPGAPPGADGATSERARATPPAAAVNIGGMATCQPGAQLSEAVSRLTSFADANGDGLVAKNEARSTANFVVGGFFFRADANGDGTVTPKEGTEARREFMSQQPALAALFEAVRAGTGKSPFTTIARMLDVDYGQPVTAEEARKVSRRAVDDFYAEVDSDRNGFVSHDEARNASWEGAQVLGQALFSAADPNADGSLTSQELQNAMHGPARAAFEVADANDNGQLTEQEAAVAMDHLMTQLGVPMKQE